jgi:predicted nucleotidyltransferase
MQIEILQKMKSKSIAFSVPEEIIVIYLYGSSARGVLREESDIDVAILPSHKTTEEERLGLIARVEGIIDKLLRKKGIHREISILDLRGKFVSLTLQYKIVTEGILLYERDTFERLEFENTVKGEYFDFVPYLRFLRKRKYGNILQKI